MTTERIENMAGGQGHVLIKRLLNEKQEHGRWPGTRTDQKTSQ